jgi:hypothetical protein
MTTMRGKIKAVADPVIEGGGSVRDVQLAVFEALGIGIGGGGGGGGAWGDVPAGQLPPPCPYCGASGGGGHGGMCPNAPDWSVSYD